jgi:hypothetical protein
MRGDIWRGNTSTARFEPEHEAEPLDKIVVALVDIRL